MATYIRSSGVVYDHFDPGPEPSFEEDNQDPDVEMTMDEDEEEVDESDVMEQDPVNRVEEDRIIIAIDFGTTFSSVAYTVLPKGVPPETIDINSVSCIGNYPGYEPPPGVPDGRQDVPTELWYDDRRRTRRDRSTNRADDDQIPDKENEESSSGDDDFSDDEQSQFEDDGGLEANSARQPRNTCTLPATQYWGFEVQQKLSTTDVPRDEARPLTRFKLILDNKKETDDIRTDLRTILKALSMRRIIKKDTDIYTHYLTHLLRHTKELLHDSGELRQDMLVQFVLCVPAKWPANACRIMQTALEEAVRESGLSKRAEHNVHNLFMISEPEAAAECILAEAKSELFRDKTVTIINAGGGNVSAMTYKCDNDNPIRLSNEVVAPDSKLCGAGYINEKFEQKLLQKLASETYLIKNGNTLKSIVQAQTAFFENYQKRRIDTSDRRAPKVQIYIDGLRENQKKHFRQNLLELKRNTVRKFFEGSLIGVQEVLNNQLELAQKEGCRVQKVILTGGFGQSPSLQSRLRTYLEEQENINGWEIELVVPKNPSTAVARGAVLRALNKRLGPDRITQCSYGFLVSEPYEPEIYEEHRGTRCRINKSDGERYVDETIYWVIQQGERVRNMQVFTYPVKHTFAITKKHLLCAEQLWMSDSRHPLHYRKTHAANKGAEMVGSIVADLTFLKDEGLIQPQSPSEFSTHSSLEKQHWEVFYDVAMIVEGRSIRFEARWPCKTHLEPGQHQRVLAMKLLGIAAAFRPGTA